MVFSYRFALLAILAVIPVLLLPSWLTIISLVGLLAIVAGIDVLLAFSPQHLGVTRELDSTVRQGEIARSSITLHNPHTSKHFRGSVRDGWQPSAGVSQKDAEQSLEIPAGEKRTVTMSLQPTRRGTLRTRHLTIRSWGPLGMVGRQHTRRSEEAQAHISVLPPFHSRRHLPSRLAQLREMDGRSAVQIQGAGHEFDSLRAYVRGDDVRSLDWRATARAQELVVRTWRPERDRRVIIVLDSSRTQAVRVGDETRFDAALESALLMAALASAGGDRVEVFAMDQVVRARASSSQRGSGSGALLNRIVTSLADVQPRLIAADWSQLPLEIARFTKQRALVVVLTALDPAALEQGLIPVLPALSRRHQVLIGAVQDPELMDLAQQREDISSTYVAASAEQDHARSETLVWLLNRLGAEVVQASPDELPPAVADTYLRLKAAGKL